MPKRKIKIKTIILISVIFVVIALLSLLIYCNYVGAAFFRTRVEYGRYGKWNNVIIAWQDDYVALRIEENGETVFAQSKIFYFLPTEDYLYAITKWDEYIVVDLKTNEVIVDTDNYGLLSDELKKVFESSDNFIDASAADDMIASNVVSFGDGTIYLQKFSDYGHLYTQKTDNKSDSQSLITETIDRYILKDNLLYLVTDNSTYIIVDVDTYKTIFSDISLSILSEECQAIFNEEEMTDAFCD